MRKNGRSFLLQKYVTREFIKNFLVAFVFFFAVFFVNSILVLVQKILLKNISVPVMVEMVLLYMPQFLVYTFPFATLTASSMVLGDLSSSNELLAIRSLGLSNREIYSPIIVLALLATLMTFVTADILQPRTSVLYREKLSLLMAQMPTLEIESNSINNVGDVVLSNGRADGSTVEDIILMSRDDGDFNRTVTSRKGTLEIVDPYWFIYSFDLEAPEILLSDGNEKGTYAHAEAEEARFYLDFSSQIPQITNTSPVNLSSMELVETIGVRNESEKAEREMWAKEKEKNLFTISRILLESDGRPDAKDSYEIYRANMNDRNMGTVPMDFYAQYYKAELTKKSALSLACLVFALVTLPLSNLRVRHGKLTGFAVSILIAVAYWYMLFGAQLMIFNIGHSPYLLILLPDLALAILAFVLLYVFRKAR